MFSKFNKNKPIYPILRINKPIKYTSKTDYKLLTFFEIEIKHNT